MAPLLEDYEDQLDELECENCCGAAVDLIVINGNLVCLACVALRNGKRACDE